MRKQAPIYKLKISITGAPYPLWRRIIARGDDTLLLLHGYIMQVMNFSGYHLWNFDTAFGSFAMEEDFSTGYLPPYARKSKAAKAKKDESTLGFADKVVITDLSGYHLWNFDTAFGSFAMKEDFSTGNLPPYARKSKTAKAKKDESTLWFADDVAIMDVAGPKTKFLYTYDYGDYWRHAILVEDVAESFPKVTNEPPYCLGGRGDSPMEECGGVWMLRDMVEAWTEIQELKKQGVELSKEEIEEKYGEIVIPYSDERKPRCVHPSYALERKTQAPFFSPIF